MAAVSIVTLAPTLPGVSVVGGVLRLLELRSYDLRMDLVDGPPRASGSVVLVDVDARTLARLGRWPFSRAALARAMDRAARDGAAVVALSIQLRDPTSADEDGALSAVIRAWHPRMVLARAFNPDHTWRPMLDHLDEVVDDPRLGPGWGPPLAVTEIDRSKRRIPLAWSNPPSAAFSLIVAGRYLHARPMLNVPGVAVIGKRIVPYGYDGTLIVRPPDYQADGQIVSFLDLYDGKVPPDRLKDKIVLFSAPHDEMLDRDDPPAFVQAAAIEQVLVGAPAIHLPPQVTVGAAAIVVLTLLVIFYRHTWWRSLPAALLFLALYAGVTVYLLESQRFWLDLVTPSASGLACIVAVGLSESWRLKRFLVGFLPRDLVESADAANLLAVLETAREMSSTLDVDALLARLERHLEASVPHDVRAIYLLDPESGRVLQARRMGLEMDQEAPLIESRGERPPAIPGLASFLAVPMRVEDMTSGLVFLGSRRPAAFGGTARDLVATLAFHVASLLRNAQLHRELLDAHRALAESRAQLVQSSKMAAIGQLAAGVAHEINNPLGAVSLSVDSALAQAAHPDKVTTRLRMAKGAIERVRAIIQTLQDFSADQAPRDRLALHRLVADTLSLLRGELEKDGIQVIERCDEAGEVSANPAQIRQVVTNLVANAREAVRDGDVREIRVTTMAVGEEAVLEISDSGRGIPEELRERIFEPFFTTRPVGHGTGLGLWVCRRVVDDHGGRLELDDRPTPTTFRVRLPRRSV
jgi:signal transduction histidine kinase